jgi:hypothetical protein
MPNNQWHLFLEEAHRFTCTGMTQKGPLFLGGTPLQRRLGFRIRPRSTDVIFQISEPSSLVEHLQHQPWKDTYVAWRVTRHWEGKSPFYEGESHQLLFPFVCTIYPSQKELPVVVCIRTDTRNSTEYWPCAASDMIQPPAMMVKFSCSTLRGELSMSYFCFSDKTFESEMRESCHLTYPSVATSDLFTLHIQKRHTYTSWASTEKQNF